MPYRLTKTGRRFRMEVAMIMDWRMRMLRKHKKTRSHQSSQNSIKQRKRRSLTRNSQK